jgi:hypothetical protein
LARKVNELNLILQVFTLDSYYTPGVDFPVINHGEQWSATLILTL